MSGPMDPNVDLTRFVRMRRQALAQRTVALLEQSEDLVETQRLIQESEGQVAAVLRNDASTAFAALRGAGLLKRVIFLDGPLGVSLALARFEAPEAGGDAAQFSRRLVIVEAARSGVAAREVAPSDELVALSALGEASSLDRTEDWDMIIDPTIEAFAGILLKLRVAQRPLALVFATGGQPISQAAPVEPEPAPERADRGGLRLDAAPPSPADEAELEDITRARDERRRKLASQAARSAHDSAESTRHFASLLAQMMEEARTAQWEAWTAQMAEEARTAQMAEEARTHLNAEEAPPEPRTRAPPAAAWRPPPPPARLKPPSLAATAPVVDAVPPQPRQVQPGPARAPESFYGLAEDDGFEHDAVSADAFGADAFGDDIFDADASDSDASEPAPEKPPVQPQPMPARQEAPVNRLSAFLADVPAAQPAAAAPTPTKANRLSAFLAKVPVTKAATVAAPTPTSANRLAAFLADAPAAQPAAAAPTPRSANRLAAFLAEAPATKSVAAAPTPTSTNRLSVFLADAPAAQPAAAVTPPSADRLSAFLAASDAYEAPEAAGVVPQPVFCTSATNTEAAPTPAAELAAEDAAADDEAQTRAHVLQPVFCTSETNTEAATPAAGLADESADDEASAQTQTQAHVLQMRAALRKVGERDAGLRSSSDGTMRSDSTSRRGGSEDAAWQPAVASDWRADAGLRGRVAAEEAADEAEALELAAAAARGTAARRERLLAAAAAEEAAEAAEALEHATRIAERKAQRRAAAEAEADRDARFKLDGAARAKEAARLAAVAAYATAATELERARRIADEARRESDERKAQVLLAARLAEGERFRRVEEWRGAEAAAREASAAARNASVAEARAIFDTEKALAAEQVRGAEAASRVAEAAARARRGALARGLADAEQRDRVKAFDADATGSHSTRARVAELCEDERASRIAWLQDTARRNQVARARRTEDVCRAAEEERSRRVRLLVNEPLMMPWPVAAVVRGLRTAAAPADEDAKRRAAAAPAAHEDRRRAREAQADRDAALARAAGSDEAAAAALARAAGSDEATAAAQTQLADAERRASDAEGRASDAERQLAEARRGGGDEASHTCDVEASRVLLADERSRATEDRAALAETVVALRADLAREQALAREQDARRGSQDLERDGEERRRFAEAADAATARTDRVEAEGRGLAAARDDACRLLEAERSALAASERRAGKLAAQVAALQAKASGAAPLGERNHLDEISAARAVGAAAKAAAAAERSMLLVLRQAAAQATEFAGERAARGQLERDLAGARDDLADTARRLDEAQARGDPGDLTAHSDLTAQLVEAKLQLALTQQALDEALRHQRQPERPPKSAELEQSSQQAKGKRKGESWAAATARLEEELTLVKQDLATAERRLEDERNRAADAGDRELAAQLVETKLQLALTSEALGGAQKQQRHLEAQARVSAAGESDVTEQLVQAKMQLVLQQIALDEAQRDQRHLHRALDDSLKAHRLLNRDGDEPTPPPKAKRRGVFG
ncbi:hypothetical protein M885DRAFT_520356 [Pelagophyceae sp. CCMP2097]|nr:hypothetical protein M885DRAFT_520356 [Pelagophyceae sp. CCMP2097]